MFSKRARFFVSSSYILLVRSLIWCFGNVHCVLVLGIFWKEIRVQNEICNKLKKIRRPIQRKIEFINSKKNFAKFGQTDFFHIHTSFFVCHFTSQRIAWGSMSKGNHDCLCKSTTSTMCNCTYRILTYVDDLWKKYI